MTLPGPHHMAPLPAVDPTAAVRLRGIGKSFDGVRVLHDLSVSVRRGSIHALLGGNGSGKSTTLKILAGVYAADTGGVIEIDGESHATEEWSAGKAYRSGLRFVHQDLALADDLTVAENFGLVNGFPPTALRGISWRALRQQTAEALDALEVDVDPSLPVSRLSASERTMVAIARSLGTAGTDSALTIVLDEPTASLPHSEVELLLEHLRRCRERGQSIVYVSHRLPEVLALADHITVLRDGRVVADTPAEELDERRIVTLMAGDADTGEEGSRSAPAATGEEILGVTGLSVGPLEGVGISVREGEVVGVAGLTGSGRSSLLRAVFGHATRAAGEIRVEGRTTQITHPADAMRHGIAFVPEDRKRDGAFLDAAVWENMTAASLPAYWRRGRMDRAGQRRDAADLAARFRVKTRGIDTPLRLLSGGNQQKAVMARWLHRAPRILLLDEPSQGVDAVARAEIHRLIRDHAAGGNAALVVSSDGAELVTLCDRVVVLRDGRITDELSGAALTEERIAYLSQFDDEEPS
ncbi:sugar ABC transporter ATP-binding protein [Microbacterium sp. NPDC077184]|uniref:sugar ABC transporter ATP-binding protein n=1 Tax=Microbacterium sp. NPDC077184 TaxID=3154764 RepID=UPI003444D871